LECDVCHSRLCGGSFARRVRSFPRFDSRYVAEPLEHLRNIADAVSPCCESRGENRSGACLDLGRLQARLVRSHYRKSSPEMMQIASLLSWRSRNRRGLAIFPPVCTCRAY